MRGDPRQLISDYRARSRSREEVNDEQLRARIAQQWAEVRATRRAAEVEPEIAGGPSNLKPAQVPYGVDLAAAWSWRFLIICGAGALILWLLNFFLVVVLPLVVALLIAALASPLVVWVNGSGSRRSWRRCSWSSSASGSSRCW